MENANADLGGLASLVPKAAAASTAALHLLLVVFGGVYLAANPALYRRGLLKLLPERARPPVAGFLDTSARPAVVVAHLRGSADGAAGDRGRPAVRARCAGHTDPGAGRA